MITNHPCRTKSSALAQPMPEAPPVMTTTRRVIALPWRGIESCGDALVAQRMPADLIKIEHHAEPGLDGRQQVALAHPRVRRRHGESVPHIKRAIDRKHLNMIDACAGQRAMLMNLCKFMKRDAAAARSECAHQRQYRTDAAERG